MCSRDSSRGKCSPQVCLFSNRPGITILFTEENITFGYLLELNTLESLQGKESIEKILQSLEEEGCKVSESFQTFGRVSLRRLGRLLPEVRWVSFLL